MVIIMNKKKVVFNSLKTDKAQYEKVIDQWVSAGEEREHSFSDKKEPTPPLKKLTLLIPEDLHTKLKILCAESKTPMAKVINELIRKKLLGYFSDI